MTLNEMSSSIRNRVADGLSGNISNQAFSTEQLNDEIDLQRSDFINQYVTSGLKLNPNYLYQTIDGLELKCINLDDNSDCNYLPDSKTMAMKIPAIAATSMDSAVEYFGLNNKQNSFIVYYTTSQIQNHKRRVRTKLKPFIWIDTTLDQNGFMTAYLMNSSSYNELKYMSIRAIFEHPSRVLNSNANFGDTEYPAPGHIQNKIIDALTEKYVRYYRQLNILSTPNTQSDNIT